MSNKNRSGRNFVWILAAGTLLFLLDGFTRSEVPYRLPATLQVVLHDADGRAVPAATVDVVWLTEDRASPILVLWPTKIASGTADDNGTLTLSLDIPGTIREGLLARARRWMGEDVIARKAAVRGVLGRTQVRVNKAGWMPLSAFLGEAKVTRGLGGESWFATRAELAMTIDLTMSPAAADPK